MLNNIKIVELATYVAAPAASALLGEWGADVIKIEPLTGCPMRQFFANARSDSFPDNPVFDLDNRGKRSLALNIAAPEAQKIVHALVRDADIFITNMRPSALAKQQMDYAQLQELKPALIYASLTGFGLEGADKDKPGFDTVAFWARSGMAWIMAHKGKAPMRLRTAVGDHVAAMGCAAGILAALVDAQKTGRGRLVESSLIRAGMYAVGSDLGVYLRYGRIATSKPREEERVPIMNFFRSQDGHWLYINARPTEADWPNIVRALNCPELEKDARFCNPRQRREHARLLVGLLDEAFARFPLAELAKRLDAEDVIWSQVNDFEAIAQDKQAEAAGAFVQTPSNSGAAYRGVATPLRFHAPDGSTHNPAPRGPAPALGEHTREILTELGWSEKSIAQAQAQKVVL